jgi:hypothetical protein
VNKHWQVDLVTEQCRVRLTKFQAQVIDGLIGYVLGRARHYRFEWALEGAIERALDLHDQVGGSQYAAGSALLNGLQERFVPSDSRWFALSMEEARLVRGLIDYVLERERYYCNDERCWEIAAAVETALNLHSAPSDSQYSRGGWALEQACFRLSPPERDQVRIGDLITIEDLDELPEGEFQVETTDDRHLGLRDQSGEFLKVERAALDLDSCNVSVERRFKLTSP